MRMSHHQGTTLLEMVIVIIVLSIIAVASTGLILQLGKAFSTTSEIVEANWQGQLAMGRMKRDMHLINSADNIISATASSLAFLDVNGNTIAYSLSGNNLMLTYNGNSAILASGVQSLTFLYIDRNALSTLTPSNIVYIYFAMNITLNNVNYTLTSGVYPRNIF